MISRKEDIKLCIRVMIADDHSMIREGIKQLLELDGDIKVVAEAGDGRECLNTLNDRDIDVLLLDINMPNVNGLQVLKTIRDKRLDIKVLILTIHNEVEYLLKAFDLGFDGYVLKDSDSSILKKAIFSIYGGETFIQPNLTPLLNAKISNRNISRSKINDLTKRELEVLKLVTEGLLNKEIGEKLCISERTVKNHISSIFKKIAVSDRTQAAVFAIRNDIVRLY